MSRNLHPYPFLQAGMSLLRLPFFDFDEEERRDGFGYCQRNCKCVKVSLRLKLVETIYFGGGTPSVLTSEEINFLIAAVYTNYKVAENPEITLRSQSR